MRHTLICTVGTSLKTNLYNNLERDKLAGLFQNRCYKELATALIEIDPQDRVCGAEINSNTSIFQKGLLEKRDSLYLLVSDTDDGEVIGRVLAKYYEHRRNPWRFKKVACQKLEGLMDTSPQRFRTEGLRNLVKAIGTIARKHGSEHLLINATGGYKAQISFAGLIAQALDIPVCYLFEKFSEVIELPPQPVSLDLNFWLENVSLFYDLDANQIEESPVTKEPLFASLVDEVEVDGNILVGLSAMGQLFHETFCYRFSLQRHLLLPPESGLDPKEKKIRYEKGLSPRPPGIEAWFEKLKVVPYVKGIYIHYYNTRLPSRCYFRPSIRGDYSHIKGSFSDGKATTKFDVKTTARTHIEANVALADLMARFRDGLKQTLNTLRKDRLL